MNYENPWLVNDFISVLVKTTISEMNQFFFRQMLKSVAMTRTISQPVRAKILGLSGGLQVRCVETGTQGKEWGGSSRSEGQEGAVWEEEDCQTTGQELDLFENLKQNV